MLKALVGIAEWQLKKGQLESALMLLAKVLDEPSIAKPLQDRAESLRGPLLAGLTPDEIHAARRRAQGESFERIARGWRETKTTAG
jgi:hypothetical protein